jgi:hypothetical protein
MTAHETRMNPHEPACGPADRLAIRIFTTHSGPGHTGPQAGTAYDKREHR